MNSVKVTLVAMVLRTGLLLADPGESQNTVMRYANADVDAFKAAAQCSTATQAAIPDNWKLVISEDGRRIQKANGEDWFWLGDTVWSLFKKLNREDVDYYMEDRAEKGFTVIQACVIMGWSYKFNSPNVYGDRPFINNDPARPNEPFWQHVDYIIKEVCIMKTTLLCRLG